MLWFHLLPFLNQCHLPASIIFFSPPSRRQGLGKETLYFTDSKKIGSLQKKTIARIVFDLSISKMKLPSVLEMLSSGFIPQRARYKKSSLTPISSFSHPLGRNTRRGSQADWRHLVVVSLNPSGGERNVDYNQLMVEKKRLRETRKPFVFLRCFLKASLFGKPPHSGAARSMLGLRSFPSDSSSFPESWQEGALLD